MTINILQPGGDNGQPDEERNDTKEVIETPGEVQESNDEKIDQDFPGYPHYPANEDILDPNSGFKKEEVDIEELSRSR
jgi:hypothetical protein